MNTELSQKFVDELELAIQAGEDEVWVLREKWNDRLEEISPSELEHYKSVTSLLIASKSTNFEQYHKKFRARVVGFHSITETWDFLDMRGVESDFFGPCNSNIQSLNAQFAVIGDVNLYGCRLMNCNLSFLTATEGASLREATVQDSKFRHTHFGESAEIVRANFFRCDFENATIGKASLVQNVKLHQCTNIPDWLKEKATIYR